MSLQKKIGEHPDVTALVIKINQEQLRPDKKPMRRAALAARLRTLEKELR